MNKKTVNCRLVGGKHDNNVCNAKGIDLERKKIYSGNLKYQANIS